MPRSEHQLALRRAQTKRWRARNPEKLREQARRQYARDPEARKASNQHSRDRRLYGIDPEDYERMLAEQGGVCAVCSELPEGSRLAVDHDHETGRVRGLLCNRCNRGIGLLGDSPERLAAAALYLEEDN